METSDENQNSVVRYHSKYEKTLLKKWIKKMGTVNFHMIIYLFIVFFVPYTIIITNNNYDIWGSKL